MNEILPKNKTSVFDSTYFWYLIVLVGAGMLYFLTCAPTALWQDSGLFIYRIWHNDIQGNLGLALAHPLYIMIGAMLKYIPISHFAHRVNLMSAVFAAIAIANLFLLLRLWLGRVIPALIGAITLAVSWNFWQHAVIAEVYTLHIALFFCELLALFQYERTKQLRYLYLLGFFNGLAMANHVWALFGLICYFVYLFVLLLSHRLKLKNLSIIALLWIIGVSPYTYLIIKNIINSGDLLSTLASAFFGAGWQDNALNVSVSVKMALENIIFIGLNFPTPNILLFFVGFWFLYKKAPSRSFANIITALLILHFLFAFRYSVPDRYAFFLPFYCFVALLIGVGAHEFLSRYKYKSLVFLILIFTLLPVPTYVMTPALAARYYKSLGQRRQRPYRNEYKYFLQPWKQDCNGAEKFATEALEMVEENAVIYAYTTDVHAFLYVQEVRGLRPDVRIVSDYDKSANAPFLNKTTFAGFMADSPVYVASNVRGYCPVYVLENYDFVKRGHLYRVVSRQ